MCDVVTRCVNVGGGGHLTPALVSDVKRSLLGFRYRMEINASTKVVLIIHCFNAALAVDSSFKP